MVGLVDQPDGLAAVVLFGCAGIVAFLLLLWLVSRRDKREAAGRDAAMRGGRRADDPSPPCEIGEK